MLKGEGQPGRRALWVATWVVFIVSIQVAAQSGLPEGLAGAAFLAGPAPKVIAWGNGVTEWPADGGRAIRYLSGRRFTAGCASGDGTLYLLEGRRLVRFTRPFGEGRVLETGTEFQDCLAWTLDGRDGVLVPHLHLQLRFYREGASARDLYSIYTPSKQGGLMERDVDGDGRMDLVWGNYWLERPHEEGGHWRLFAINLFHEEADSALARLEWGGGGLYWGTAAGKARLAHMKPPEDVRQIWEAEMLPDAPARILALKAAGDALVVSHAGGVEAYERTGKGWVRHRLTGRAAAALYLLDGAVWGVFADGPRELYRRR